MYHTFTYVAPQPGCGSMTTLTKTPSLAGTVSTPKGPAVHQLVLITLSDHSVRKVYTDSRGRYTLDSPRAGPVRVTAGGVSRTRAIATGGGAVVNLHLPALQPR
jgi:hypothetical protein